MTIDGPQSILLTLVGVGIMMLSVLLSGTIVSWSRSRPTILLCAALLLVGAGCTWAGSAAGLVETPEQVVARAMAETAAR